MTPRSRDSILVLDRESVRAVDRDAVETYGIPSIVLMENAARGLAASALDLLEAAGGPRSALIVCGGGNNGGDGYALARHLHNERVEVALAPLGDPREGSDAATNRSVCRRMNLPEIPREEIPDNLDRGLVVDAIFGTGLDRPIEGPAAKVIEWINDGGRPVLAVDVPSGLDCDTGQPLGVAVRAARTVTFVARKPGMLLPAARPFVGQIVVVGIGAPIELLERYGRMAE